MRKKVCTSCGKRWAADLFYCRHCGRPLPSALDGPGPGQDEFDVIEDSEEICLDQLDAFDYLLIRTRNNLYRFTLLEPGRGYGLLSGGPLGDYQVQAILLDTLQSLSSGSVRSLSRLRTGLSAVFHLNVTRGDRQIETSPIIELKYVRGGKTTKARPALTH